MTTSEKIINVEGLPVHYLEGGADNGRALLLLHGVGDARTNWHEVLPPLSETFHVFAPDLPGFGDSAPLPDMSLDKLIHWTRALLDALGQTDVVIIGNFAGALLARLFAAAEPQYVPAIILVNGGNLPRIPGYLPALVRLPVIGDWISQMFGRMYCSNKTLDRMIYVHDVLTETLINAWRKSAPAFTELIRALILTPRPENATPLVPTLLLWGANDKVMPLAVAEALKADIPGSVLAPVAECGAMPQLEASDSFVFQVTAFLEHMSRPATPTPRGVGMLRPN